MLLTVEQAEAVAKEAIEGYFNEVDTPHKDADFYSCNQCELNSYLCPHLYDRLKKHIVQALTKKPHNLCPYCKSELPHEQAMCIECYFEHVDPKIVRPREKSEYAQTNTAETH